jgi:hypothetical protein
MSDLHLTEDRIRALVRDAPHFQKKARSKAGRTTMLPVPDGMPDIAAGETMINLMGASIDAVVGPGGGQFLADSNRLLWLLTVLAKGTVDDAIAHHRKRAAGLEAARVPQWVADMARSNGDIHEMQLRAIPQAEVDAVMACLDEVAAVYPGPVASVRERHTVVDREKLMQAIAVLRTGDPLRPQLTADRIRRVLDVLAAVVPGPSKMMLALKDTASAFLGRPAREVFPATTVKKIVAQGEDPDLFARDFLWLRIITEDLRRSPSIDERIFDEIPRPKAHLWIEVALAPDSPERTEKIAAWMWRPLELLFRTGRDEEAAVKALLGEIQRRLQSAADIQIAANHSRRH